MSSIKIFYAEWTTLAMILSLCFIGYCALAFTSENGLVSNLIDLSFLAMFFFFMAMLVANTHISINGKEIRYTNLFFYRKTIPFDKIVEISKQPTYVMASKSFETLYIFYLDKHDRMKWIGLRNAVFSKESMIGIIKEIAGLNPAVRLDKACQKMLDKTKNN